MSKLEHATNRPLEAANLKQVSIEDPFWTPRVRNVTDTVVPYQWQALNDEIPGAEPSHTVENFRIAAGEAEGEYYGMVFQDSDLGKWLETVGFVLAGGRDPELERIADEVIDLLERAQQPDGYLNTYYQVKEPGQRWTNLRDNHELYCAGHLMEAAVAYYEATGKRKFLDVMCRYADYIGEVFGAEPGKKRGYDGHPEIELALVKLARATGEQKYMELSKFFVDERGQRPHFFEIEAQERNEQPLPGRRQKRMGHDYFQAHLPVREQKTAEGHSVRAVYLYSAMADLAAAYKDETLMEACKTLWKDVVARKMYVTGGIGSQEYGERFTVPFDLPNDRAYAETCASIGLVFWAQRMLQIEKNREYADVMELALYNGVLSGISLDGKSYFYVNPLEVWPDTADFRHDMSTVKVTRQPWFGCACCPPNIARLIASLGSYIYSVDASRSSLYVHLFIGGTMETQLNGATVKWTQRSNYPWDGRITMSVALEQPSAFDASIRIPGWCRKATVKVNGESVDASRLANGYLVLSRTWTDGDTVELELDMPVDVVRAHPNVRENAGKAALQRGPIVYCFEEADNGPNLRDLVLPANAQFEVTYDEALLGGVCTISTTGTRTELPDGENMSLYTTRRYERVPAPVTAIPYYAWSNRTPGEMTVWIRVE
ncbi:glycoside hydrolase family 127 protein [Paenibacillus sp.]|uniref:glycoside hydrolase family 127 protein n=1 Tax=Paenibacillus sp. TaxID=58172 RepID=UPI002D70ECEA|nr:beta-L-arabinofuranosidase domain-containing protein [Paenibacillus sp.]HZG87456.1 beta-L-arabinofuranosidase domain-containing protein [Paenibacillus sp.]